MLWAVGRESLRGGIRRARTEEAPHEAGRGDVVSAAAKSWVDASEEIVEMRSDDAHTFAHGRGPSARHQRHCEHRPRQKLDGNLHHVERRLSAPVILGVGVHERQNQCYP